MDTLQCGVNAMLNALRKKDIYMIHFIAVVWSCIANVPMVYLSIDVNGQLYMSSGQGHGR